MTELERRKAVRDQSTLLGWPLSRGASHPPRYSWDLPNILRSSMSFHVLVFVVSGEPEASGVGLRNLRMALVSCGAVAWRVTRRAVFD